VHDKVVNQNDARIVFEKTQGKKEYWLADTSHDVFDDNPKEYEKKIIAFLNSMSK